MINVEVGSVFDDKLLAKINEKIESINSIILSQKDEISKSEESILQFKKCLQQQNEVLNLFITEKEKLKEEKAKRSLSFNEKLVGLEANDTDYREIYDSVMKIGVQCKTKRRINRDTLKYYQMGPNAKHVDNIKLEINTEDSNEKMKNVNLSVASVAVTDLTPPIKRMRIDQIGLKKVNKIILFAGDTYIGGSGGLLLKTQRKLTQVLKTDTDEDILQMEIVKRAKKSCLFAFTSQKVLIYDGMGPAHTDVLLDGIETVFNDLNLLYIPVAGGLIKKLYIDDGRVTDHIAHSHGNVSVFIPGKGKNKFALISLKKDSLLYKTEKKDMKSLQAVEGVTGVKGAMVVRYNRCLCYSKDTIWFFNSDFEIASTLRFPEGIKLVEVTYTSGAVVDLANSVHIYPLLDSGFFGPRASVRRIDEGEITAMSIVKKNVLLSVGCDILTMENIL